MKFNKREIIQRFKKIRTVINSQHIEGLLISSSSNLLYFSNFNTMSYDERESLLLINKDKIKLFTSVLYQSQFENIFDEIEIVTSKEGMYRALSLFVKNKSIGFEESDLRVNEYQFLEKQSVVLKPIAKQISTIRTVKATKEIQLIKEVEDITQKALEAIMPLVHAGQTEREVVRILEYKMEEMGADGVGFPTIVASGPNSGSPHHNSGNRIIENGDIVLVDIGAKKDGYNGDITRTFVIGQNSNYDKTYVLVQAAHDLALSRIKSGAKIADVDMIVRNYFEQNGVLDHFCHTTGHGLGIALHELPSISYKTEGVLEEGMVITIEPGLYYDWGGVRIEDVVAVTREGYQKISHFIVERQKYSQL